MNRTPPTVCQSAVGLPPLSQLKLEGQTNDYQAPSGSRFDKQNRLDHEISPAERNITHQGKNNWRDRNTSKNQHQRGAYTPNFKSEYAPARAQSASRILLANENSELLNILSQVHQKLESQEKINKAIQSEFNQLKSEQSRSRAPRSHIRRPISHLTDADEDSEPCGVTSRIASHRRGNSNTKNHPIPKGLSAMLCNGDSQSYDAWEWGIDDYDYLEDNSAMNRTLQSAFFREGG